MTAPWTSARQSRLSASPQCDCVFWPPTTEEILMRAVTLDAFDAAPAVRDDLPDPTAAAGGLVVRVRASSVNPVDNAIAAGVGPGKRGPAPSGVPPPGC